MGLGISTDWNMPMWQPSNFNNFSTPFAFDSRNIWNNFSMSSSTSSTENETYEQYIKRRDEEQKAAAQKANEQQAIVDLNKLKQDKLKELNISKIKEDLTAQKIQLEKNKKSDGSTAIRTPYKKLGFWRKVGRWCSNAGSAIVNIGKNLVGIEKDGKWNWKKCLKNVAITAAAVGACCIPYVGPFIGYGLAATGVAMGAYGTAKGISNLKKASDSDDEAIDNAQQEIVTGLFTGITSAFGLRAIGKGVSASNASVAAERASAAGKACQTASQFGRDVTVNAWRATGEAMQADKALIASQAGKWGITKFSQATWKKMSSAYNSTKTDWDEVCKKKQSEIESTIKTKLDEATNKLATEKNSAKRALLEDEIAGYKKNLREIRSVGVTKKTKSDYDKLLEENAGTRNIKNAEALDNTVRGASVAPKRLKMYNQKVKKVQEAYSKKLAELIKAKQNAMYQKASKPDRYKQELRQYVSKKDLKDAQVSWYRPTTWRKNKYQIAIAKPAKETHYGSFLKLTTTHPASTAPKAMQIFDPIYSVPIGYGQEIASEQYDGLHSNYELQIAQLDNAIAEINNCKDVNELNALYAQIKEAINQAPQELAQEQAATSQGKADAIQTPAELPIQTPAQT